MKQNKTKNYRSFLTLLSHSSKSWCSFGWRFALSFGFSSITIFSSWELAATIFCLVFSTFACKLVIILNNSASFDNDDCLSALSNSSVSPSSSNSWIDSSWFSCSSSSASLKKKLQNHWITLLFGYWKLIMYVFE